MKDSLPLFEEAFNLAMKSEVGPRFNPNDPATISGDISTLENRRKCGYVNHPSDPGGETKFGVAKNSNPTLNIKALTLEQAKDVYAAKYWLANKCDKIPFPLCAIHFDACVNHSTKRANMMLQGSVNTVQDGSVGSVTLSAIAKADPYQASKKYLVLREAYFNSLVAAKPELKVFIKGWLSRIDTLEAWLEEQESKKQK